MINLTGSFKKHLKLYELTLFPTGSSANDQIIIKFTKALSQHYADES